MNNDRFQYYEHINVLIKPTDGCNLRCKYCFHQDYGYTPNKLDIAVLDRFLDITLPHFKSLTIVWHGGEPTFVGSDYFERCIDLVENKRKQYGTIIDHAMQTNGTLLNQRFIDIIKKYNIGVGISYDGPSNDFTRNSTKPFLKVKALLDKNAVKVGIISVVSGVNVHKLEEHYRHMKELGLSYQLNPFIDTSPNAPQELRMEVEEYVFAIERLFELWINDTNGSIVVDPCNRYIRDIIVGKSIVCARSSCMRNWFCLNADGSLTPCDRDFPDEYAYGNVTSLDDVREIYDSAGYLKLMNAALVRREKCLSTCDVFDYCEGGCNNDALYQGTLENNGGFSCKANAQLLRYFRKWLNEYDRTKVKNKVVLEMIKQAEEERDAK